MAAEIKKAFLSKEEAEAFLGKNEDYYLEKWKSHSATYLKGWNWAAMFFGIEWMAYRKMYREAALSLLILYSISFCFLLLFSLFDIHIDGKIIGDVFRLLIGIFGNCLYRNKALRCLDKADFSNECDKLAYLKAKGGTSVISVVICIILEVILVFL